VTHGGDAGASLVELLVTLAVVASLVALTVPLVGNARDHHDGRQAAAFLAGQFRQCRQLAIETGRHTAIVFEPAAGPSVGWTLRRCWDGDNDGVRRADINAGTDPCDPAAHDIQAWFGTTTIDRDAGVPTVGGSLTGASVAFGSARMASFSPLGTASSGSVTLRTRGGAHFAVGLAGVTGRVRLYQFAPGPRLWQPL
jgi:type II secretory pathway pseudopilin PulG